MSACWRQVSDFALTRQLSIRNLCDGIYVKFTIDWRELDDLGQHLRTYVNLQDAAETKWMKINEMKWIRISFLIVDRSGFKQVFNQLNFFNNFSFYSIIFFMIFQLFCFCLQISYTIFNCCFPWFFFLLLQHFFVSWKAEDFLPQMY